ncbi:ribonuclease H-like domain-containing protein [Tanacetum coccineum]
MSMVAIKEFAKQHANIDLMLIGPSSFDIIIGSGQSQTCCLRTLCLSDESLVILLEEIQANDKLHFVKEPVEIIDREVKRLKQSRIPIFKIHACSISTWALQAQSGFYYSRPTEPNPLWPGPSKSAHTAGSTNCVEPYAAARPNLAHGYSYPNIIKNLISIRQFTRDNNCTIEFDAFGFSVKDFLTRHILLRCDSSGDLYPVTKPSTSPTAFLSISASTWHQRLGHPGDEVLRSLVSRRFISCNKEKAPHLCHACQLGKHVKLPFHSSDSIVENYFDIIHSDLWTSPIVSSSSFKYYVLFHDHFSHYLWIYPLRSKSDMFDKFFHFRTYVKNQFKCEIKSFQCDHGGEFDNNRLHTLFAKNGIQLRFSCPKTSQQNGKAERMIRTINNIIRTLLFQAHLPLTFWVEALHMATYLLNLLPSTAINNEVPFTLLFNKQPDYSRL